MRNDVIKYIVITIVIIGLIWWLLNKDNNSAESLISGKSEVEGISTD